MPLWARRQEWVTEGGGPRYTGILWLKLLWNHMQWLHHRSFWLQRRGSFLLHYQFCASLHTFSHEALQACHTCIPRAIHAAVILSQKTEQKRTIADRDKNWIPGNGNVHSHCWKQLYSFRNIRASACIFVCVLSLFKQGQLSQENQGMDFIALLFSTCFPNHI